MLTIAQLGFLPNLVIFALSWSTGAGFSLGVGSTAGPLGTAVGPLPAVPVLGALPAGQLDAGAMALALPVIAGILAGWWFLREGENHFDEWLSIKIKARWFTATVSTLFLGAFIGAVAGLSAVPWRGSRAVRPVLGGSRKSDPTRCGWQSGWPRKWVSAS